MASSLLSVSRLLHAVVLMAWWAVCAAQLTNPNNPSVVYHDANTALTQRSFPACAFDITALATLTPNVTWYSFGGGASSTFDVTTQGSWDSAATTFSTIVPSFNFAFTTLYQPSPIARIAGAAAVLGNKNVLYGGGKASGSDYSFSTYVNDVIYSTNNGNSWSLATPAAAWPARSDHIMVAAPGSNNVLVIGGTSATGTQLQDVWLCTDGIGANWTLQTTTNPPWPGFSDGSATFLYDSPATLILYSPNDGYTIYKSTDLGKTFTKLTTLSTSFGVSPGIDVRMIADAQSNLYLAGGNNGLATILYSSNAGVTWSYLNTIDWNSNITNTVQLVNNPAGPGAFPTGAFTYGCMAMRYTPSATAQSGYHKQLSLYAGFIYVDSIVDSGYNCYIDTGTSQVNSVVADIIAPGDVWTYTQPQVANTPGLIFHDAASLLPDRLYADCGYDVHQAAPGRRGANFSMWQMGGFNPINYAFLNGIDYTGTGNWANLQEFQTPVYNNAPGGNVPSGRVAGGIAYLANGNLLYFGGKDANASVPNYFDQYSNDVYSSSNYGASFTYVGAAGFSPRSDFATTVMPMTNTVIVAGGMFAAGGASNGPAMNDVWYSTDPTGAKTWTQATAAALMLPWTDAAFCALYDSVAVSSSNTQQNGTLLIYTGAYELIYYSTNLGATWQVRSTAPWPVRLHSSFVADADNFVYFTGGSSSGDLYYSPDGGSTWIDLNTVPYGAWGSQNRNGFVASNIYANLNQYIGIQGTSGNCMALRYVPNSNSPGGYHKQLVLYGGGFAIQVASRPAPACVQSASANVLYGELMFPSEITSTWTDTSGVGNGYYGSTNISWNSPSVLLTTRNFPTCASDVHSIVNHPSSPMAFALGGWDATNNVLNTYDRINGSAFASYVVVPAFQGATPGRAAGGAAYLNNGRLLWFGGKINQNTAGAAVVVANDVWYNAAPNFNFGPGAANAAQQPLWIQATNAAQWKARSDMSVAVFPGTNNVLLAGGSDVTGTLLNDVWLSTDGAGATWSPANAAAPFPPFSQGAIVALYDGQATSGSQQYATVVLFASSYPTYNQYVWQSTNQGTTWTTLGVAPWSTRFSEKFVADAENNIFMVGGQSGDSWWSSNKGQSWSQLRQTTNAGYPSPVQLSAATYSCAGLLYQSGSGPNGYHRQLVVFSGTTLSVFNPAFTFGGLTTYGSSSVSISQCLCDTVTGGVRALAADLIFAGESVSPVYVSGGGTTNAGGTSASSSSSGSKTFSRGATAGIAVGVGVGCMLLCCLAFLLYTMFTRGNYKSSGAPPSKLEEEPSRVSASEAHPQTEMVTA